MTIEEVSVMSELNGLRVLDLTRVLAGPYCTGLLADLGADVVKVENPGGDSARHLGPFRDGESVYFAQLNRGKRSVCLDLKKPEDLEIFLELVAAADVLVENFRPGVTARLGIDYERLAAFNPRLVYASISGFGQGGPLSPLPAYDLVVQAMSGLMAGTGTPEGEPTRIGESMGDLIAGLFGAWGVSVALLDRQRTGRGRHVDVAMFDSLVSLQVTAMSLLTAHGELPGRIGNRHPVSAPFDTYPTKDGQVAIAVASTGEFLRFCAMVGKPEAGDDPRFADDSSRAENRQLIDELARAWSSALTSEQAVQEAGKHRVAAAPIWDFAEAVRSQQAAYRGLVGEFQHDTLGTVPYLTQPVRFSPAADQCGSDPQRQIRTARPSPKLGADLASVLQDWLDDEGAQVAALLS